MKGNRCKDIQTVEYLEDFFETHRSDLQSNHYRETQGIINIEDAVFRTIDEAEDFEYHIKEVAETGKENDEETLHDLIFHPLHKNDISKLHQQNKAYGPEHSSWLRLYAI